MAWEMAVSIDEIDKRPGLLKSGRKQIAVYKVNGQVYAIDNRCPHEGFPLVEGTVDDQCRLTCKWHNWKFRLQDGKCVLGGDNVRAYPAKMEDGHVWVNTADPPQEVIQNSILEGLRTAFDERDFGRICREISRLHFNQLDPLVAVRKGVEWTYDKLEFGYTHAYAASADWLVLAAEYAENWEKQLICLAEAVDHMASDSLRHATYSYTVPGEEAYHANSFLTAVESERRADAEALVQRGLQDGLHWTQMEPAFAEAALAHYSDFGHVAIYVYKTGQMLRLTGEASEQFLLLSLARCLCYTTREDLIPEFKGYAPALAELPQPAEYDATVLHSDGVFPATTGEALRWVAENATTHRASTLFDVLLEALARNLLHYDTTFQDAFNRPVNQNVGWLNFTHGITFANAIRNICDKHHHLWRQGLLQMACFVGRNRRFLDLQLDESPWIVEDRDACFTSLQDTILDHGLRDPIFSAHLLKTVKAVEAELPHATASCQKYLLAGLNRFVHSPLKQKHTRRLARQAIELVKRDFD